MKSAIHKIAVPIVVAAMTLFAGITVALLPQTASATVSQTVSPTSPRLAPSAAKIMNYYPSADGWDKMWTSYSHAQVDSDFASIASLGANTVRLIIQPSAFGWPAVTPAAAANLRDAINTAAAHGLYVQLTLFDLWGLYTSVDNSKAWVQSLLSPYANDSRIALVELQNEIDPTDANAMSWAKSMLAYLPQVLPGVPRTLSVAGENDPSDVQALLTGIPSNLLDVVDLHLYSSLDDNALILKAAAALAGSRPIIVGEAGMPTASTSSTSVDYSQASYFSSLLSLIRSFGISSFAPWTLNDFTSGGLRAGMAPTQALFGLRRTDGVWKPSSDVVRAMFATASQSLSTASTFTAMSSSTTYDGTFAQEATTPTPSGLLGYWSVANGQFAGQAGVNPTAGREGGPAAYLSHTTGTSSSVPAIFQQLPLGAASAIHLTAYARLTAATGSTRAAIAWFSASGFISQVEAPMITNASSAWQLIDVTGMAPAGATSFQVHLKSQGNSGTAYFDDVQIQYGQTSSTTTSVSAPSYDGTFDHESATPSSTGVLGYWAIANRQYVGQAGVNPTAGREGGAAAYLTGTTGTSNSVPAIYQQLALGNAANVQLTAYARLAGGTGSTRAALAWFSGNTYLGQVEAPMISNASTDWQPITISAAVPAGATAVQIHLKSQNNSGTAYFDDVQVQYTRASASASGDAGATASTTYDGTFDQESATPSATGVLGYWAVANGQYVGTAGVNPTAGRSGGPAAYLAQTTGTSSSVPAIFQQFALGSAKSVHVTAYARVAAGTGSTRAAIAWFNGTTFLSQVEAPMINNASTDWQLIDLSANAPAGATAFQIVLKSQGNSGTSYFDDVTVSTSASLITVVAPTAASLSAQTAYDGTFDHESALPTATGLLGDWSVVNRQYVGLAGVNATAGTNGGPAAYLAQTTGPSSNVPGISQQLPVGPAQSIHLTLNARLASATGSTRAAIAWFNGSTFLSQVESPMLNNYMSVWQPIDLSSNVPAGATAFQVVLKSQSNSGTAYFDDVTVQYNVSAATAPAAPTLASLSASATYDGTFDKESATPSSTGVLGYWAVANGQYVGQAGVNATAGQAGGPAAYLAQTTGTSSSVPAIFQQLPVGSAKSVHLTVYARVAAGTGSTRAAIAWFNGTTFISQVEAPMISNTSTGWQLIDLTGAVPADATSVQITLKSQGNSGTAYFDNALVQYS